MKADSKLSMSDIKSVVRSKLSTVVVRSGLSALIRKAVPKKGAVIFYGHRVGTDDLGFLPGVRPEWFEDQIRHIARHFDVVPLTTIVEHFERGEPIPDGMAAITMDDGFRDNLELAFPIFERVGVPATIFVVTGSMSSGELPWPQRLGWVFQHATASHFEDGDLRFPLGTRAERHHAYVQVRRGFFALPRAERDTRIDAYAAQLGAQPPTDRMLNWDDLRAMQVAGVVAGAHTVSHPWLGFVPPGEARAEMAQCRDDLREHLGLENTPFCFPAGSCTPDLVAEVSRLGFRSSFLPKRPYRVNTLANATPYTLARVGLPDRPVVELAAQLDGPFYAAQKLKRRLRPDNDFGNDRKWRGEDL